MIVCNCKILLYHIFPSTYAVLSYPKPRLPMAVPLDKERVSEVHDGTQYLPPVYLAA